MEILFVVVTLIVIYGGIWLYEKKRTGALRETAKKLGFEFSESPPHDFNFPLDFFHLFSLGRSGTVKNVFYNASAMPGSYIFGYEYTTGHGKHQTSHTQTVISFSDEEYVFPIFDLRPENFLHKIGQFFGFQDINFDSNPAFSSKYLLESPVEDKVRAFFTPGLPDFLEKRKGVCVETRGSVMIIYIADDRVRPDDMAKFIKDSEQVYKRFCAQLSKDISSVDENNSDDLDDARKTPL